MMVRIALVVALAACQADIAVGESPGVLFGASVQPRMLETEQAAITRGEKDSGRHFDLHRIYHQWDDAVPGALEQWTIANGRTPIVSFKTTLHWADLAAGAGDDKLSAMAAGYAALGAPVFCIFDQNPENTTPGLGSPADFAAAYRHIVLTFRAAGVTNVMWIFNLKSPSFPDLADQFYPGDDVIDWNGVAAYNFGVNMGGRWVSFADLIADFIAWSTPHGKPLIVSEWASTEDASQPGRKAMWIQNARAAIQTFPQVRAMSTQWVDDNDLNMDSSPSSLAAFRAFAADPYTHLRDSP